MEPHRVVLILITAYSTVTVMFAIAFGVDSNITGSMGLFFPAAASVLLATLGTERGIRRYAVPLIFTAVLLLVYTTMVPLAKGSWCMIPSACHVQASATLLRVASVVFVGMAGAVVVLLVRAAKNA